MLLTRMQSGRFSARDENITVVAELGLLLMQGGTVATLNEEKSGMLISNLGGEHTSGSDESDFCILGPFHPDECSTGTHSYTLYGAHGFFWTAFSGTVTSEVDWGSLEVNPTFSPALERSLVTTPNFFAGVEFHRIYGLVLGHTVRHRVGWMQVVLGIARPTSRQGRSRQSTRRTIGLTRVDPSDLQGHRDAGLGCREPTPSSW